MWDKKLLKDLTNIRLSGSFTSPEAEKKLQVDGVSYELYETEALVVGTGAAGLRCAVELANRKVEVLMLSTMLYSGTSACSGSDKQTIFSCAAEKHGDDVLEVAQAIGSGGAMDLDTAYVEAVNSYLALGGLRSYGLRLPTDQFGGILRYKTDHDEAGRATSCGPRTSRMMVEVLSNKARELGIKLLDLTTAVELIVDDNNKCLGVIAVREDPQTEHGLGTLIIIRADAVILAGGGAGNLYKDSVYPYGCYGTVGLALKAGAEACNLQEMQFGITTNRSTFPWNLSGSYMQVIPDLYSVDPNDPKKEKIHFLKDYFRNTAEICSNIFRKGYQWPILAKRTLNFGSSLIDLAIYIENEKGRRVFLDFRHNYEGPAEDEYDFNKLDDEVKSYMLNSGFNLASPIERLLKMNPLAAELYFQNGVDLAAEPLEFSVNHQHFNGGLEIDLFGRVKGIERCYSAGESAGTHGVTRPGGSALNSGQVFAVRISEEIAAQKARGLLKDKEPEGLLEDLNLKFTDTASRALKSCLDFVNLSRMPTSLDAKSLEDALQLLMTQKLGFITSEKEVHEALDLLCNMLKEVLDKGLNLGTSGTLSFIFNLRNVLYQAVAVAASLSFYLESGGGSRGARIIKSSKPDALVPQIKTGMLSDFAFAPENEKLKEEIIEVKFKKFSPVTEVKSRPLRPLPDLGNIFFEKNWADFLNNSIYMRGYADGEN